MSTQRRIRRSNEKLKTKQVETAVEKRPKLAQRIISAVTAMGIFANPLVASAQIISGAEFTNVTTNGSVIDIETKKIIDRTGVNVFQQFGLNANQIANMYFGSKDSNNQADNLVNFVNSHIDINGTVNAVKNNKIGGNLYFLSKDGMAVGSSGVINTGALHVMTPTAAQMTAMQNVLSAGTNDAQKAQLELLRNSPAQIPLNPSGTITVLGKINATNKIDLRAANILVGIDGNKNINKAAALNTGVVDFTDLVNIQGSSGAVQSGLTGALTATMDTGSGDIILKASADAGTKSIADGAPGFIKDKLDGLADEVTYREITASVQNYGTIAAAGGVDISATAQNVKRTETGAEEAGSLAQVTATVDLAAGSVSGVKDVTVQAVAKNEYVDEDGLVHKAAVLGLGAATPITGDVAFAVLETEAAVNIGQEAAVSSSGGDVAITAESTTLAATQASATGYKFASKGGQKGTYVPAGAVTYTEASNKAVVNVDGKVNAQGDVEVKAKADLKIDATDNLAVKGENANQIVVGVLVTNGDNTAQVNINKNQTAGYEKALTAGGDIVIGTEAVNDLNSELNVAGADASALVTAVNVTTYNSRAGVNVDRSLEAGNDLSVSADNTFTKNTVISSNKIGSGKYMAKAMETLNKVGATDALKAVGGKVKDALFKSDGEGGADGMTYEGIKLADFLKAGATVAVVNENNTAAVNIGSEAGLTAQEGQLTLDARMQMDDIHMVASGASNSYTKEHGGGLVGNATVMVTNLEDTATVTVADRSETNAQPAALTGKKGVAVNSRVLVDYNRVQKMVDDVKRAAADIKAGFSGLGGSISSDWEALLKAVTDKADALEAALGTFTADETLLTSDDGILKATNPFSAATELLSALDTLNEQIAAAEKDPAQQTTAAKLKQAVSGLSDIVVNSIAFADPNSYANFAAVSNAKGDDGGGSGTGTAATIAGTVMITNVDHGSKVLLGNNVQINSEGTVDVGAENLMKDVSLAGVTAAIFNNAGGNSSVGATVNIADFDTNTVVAVGEGSHITGGEINIAGTNTIDHVAVAASAGKGASGEAGASGVTLNGMVSVISGDSKVLTIVDDEASLTAQQNGSGAAETSGKVTVKGLNDTSLVNVAGGLSMTHSNGAVGIGVAVNDFAVHNIAGIGDVKGFSDEVFGADNDEMSGDEGYTTAYTATGAVKKAASVQAYGLDVAAVTDGTINTVSAAGSVSSNDSSGKEGFFDKLGNKMNSLTDKVLGENGLVGKAGSIFADKVNGDGSSSSAVDDAFNVNGTGQGGGQLNINRDNQGGSQGFMPEFSISGSGSVSVNSLSNETKAVVDNAVISLNDGDMSVTARDNAFVGAYSGAAALVWKSSGENGAKGKSAALAGAAAVNDIDNTISAIVANSTINDAGKLDVLGLSGGTTIAAGLGLEISKNEGGSGTGGAAVSVNLIDHTVNALMEDNTVTKAQSIDVTGYQSDVQVTGGLQVAAGNQGTAVGASVAVASLNNTINAGIKGTGKNGLAYTDVGNVEVHALSALTAVTAAVSAGATKTSKSDGTSVNIQGAGVYNSVNNTANAYIDGANIVTTAAGSVRVRAMDTNKQDAAVYQELLTRGASDKAAELARTSSIIDTKGNSYYDGLDTAMTDDGSGDGTLDLDTIGKNGSTIVTAAAGVAVTNGDAAVGASVAISDIDNKFTAKITDSEITAADVEAQANSDTLLVGVAGGVGVGNKIGGVGSASWQNIDNTAAATISGSTIKAQSVSGRAVNTAKMINVAGQIAGGKSALGAGLGYSGLSNVTGAYLHDNLIDKRIIDTDGVIVNANAANGNKMYTIGASVAAATENAAITGTVVLTRADGKTDALISDSEITNAKEVGAAAADTTYTYTVMGNVAAGAKAGVGAGVGAGIGLSVGVLQDDSVTEAEVSGSTVNSSGNQSITATNKTVANPAIAATGVAGAGAGVAGAVSVNNINSKVKTNITNAALTAANGSIAVAAKNTVAIDAYTGGIAAGAVGVGASVTVNTIDSTVQSNVTNSNLTAQKDITVTAEEFRDISQLATNAAAGGAAVGGNILITNVGKALNDADENEQAAREQIEAANAAYGDTDMLSFARDLGALEKGSIEADANTVSVGAGFGGGRDSQISVNIKDGSMTAQGNLAATAKETGDITMTGGSGAVGSAAVNAGVGILNVHRNLAVKIEDAMLTGAEIKVGSDINGATQLNMYQGSGGILGVNAAYGRVSTEGSSDVKISGSSLTATKNDVAVTANDSSSTSIEAVGISGGAVALGVIVAQAENTSNIGITVDKSSLKAEKNVDISAERKARDANGKEKDYSLSVNAIAGSGGLVFAGAGVSAQATENGTVKIDVTSQNSLTAGKDINITALNAPAVKAVTGAISGSMLASAAVTVAQANIGTSSKGLQTSVTIGDNNILTAGSEAEPGAINVKAEANARQYVDMQALSISASPFPGGAAQINNGGSSIYSKVSVNAGKNIYRGYALGDDNYEAADLRLEANNSVAQQVKASGISVGTAFATGTNLAATLVDLTTEAIAAGSKSGSHINDLAVSAKSYADINSEANGYGGALVDISPYAAKVENEYRADTDARVSGNWDTDGAVTVSALNGNTVELHSDAVRAAVIGGSGVWLKNAISNDANTTVSSATISSDGTQTYTAQNNVDYTGKIDASGYGGLNINASNLEDDFVFNAGVNIDESTLTGTGAKGSITAQALTQGTIDSTNSLKSAGVIPVSLAFSKHDIAYNNDITVNGSILKTAKKDQDITLAASDDTEVRLETIADTQGGAIGAASAKAENSLQRSNKLKVAGNSYLESTNDVNLYAGSNSGGINSSLDLEVLADAYNKTALPVYTDPSVKNTMVQSNQVMIAGGSTVGSVRHVNVKAGKGKTTVTESAREYNIYTGTGGSGSVASTALGENIKSETADNYADISGVVKSGIHNKLQVDIGGATKTTAPTYDENGNLLTSGGVSYEGITITIGEGSDWFDAEELTPAAIVIINGLFDRYKEVSGLMQDYLQGSDEYNAYKNELSSIVLEMRNAGMVALDQNGNQTDIPVDQINVAAIKLPDIVVSGGNINIEADKLQGTGSMTAQGAPQLTINNSSDLYLAVGDLTIKDAGGQLKFNESDLKSTSSGNNFTGTTKADGLGTDAPTITVNSNSSSAFAGNPSPQADIGIFGDITNTAGDIKVNNDNYNVLVQGNISGRNITLSAVNGSVTQTSSEGLINIGGDPVTRYQFSDAVAKKIQNYLYQKGSNVTYTFNSYEEYKNWLINTVGIDAAELNYTVDESAGIVAGDNVYISGLNVNIGGLVQSGYGSYSTELSAADASKVAALDAGWAANQRPLSDNEVMSNEAYCINGGGKVWNSTTKVWDYEVKVYYNPSTKQLLTDSITPNGGKIYITGKISSTGNGRLMAMDGAADISINTAQIDRAVKVNTITNNDISGLISITDKNTNLVTEYMNGQQRSYAVGTATVNLPAWTAGADTYTYTPKNGLQYQWTGGVSGETTKKYSYSEKFLFWGLLDYGNTGEFVAGLNRDGKTYTYTTSSGSGQSLATGSVITTGNLSNQFKISSNYYNTGTEQYSEVTADKRYDGTAGKIFGYGTTYYYWTGKQGTANSSTSSLKADYGIDIGFLGNGQGSGNINVTSNQDMVLAGNISNAAVIDNSGDSNYKGLGNVTLTSNHGSVTSLGNAKINSDDVVVRADTGIQVNHAAIGSKATVDAATNDGNINFLSDRGDLNIVRMVTGGSRAINAETGNIYLQAEGSIFDTAGGSYAIKGQRIDLLSRTGAIGTKGQSLRVLGGSELFSGDSMTSSVNATAQGDIVLTQTSGNMRLGTIESANGDAVLTVADGSFVDAYNEDSVGLSDSAAKVDRWLENGLISSADADDSSSQAAEDAKAERLAGLDSRAEALAGGEAGKIQAYKDAAQAYADDGDLQTAKAVYIEAMQKADGISDATEKNEAITDAYTAYQQAQENYFANTGYSSDEQNLVASYAEVSSSGNYGWSKNQLLYAIQESVINSKPGQVQTVAKANVTANNITLTAANGGIGVDAADRVINYADLGQLENLQLLASAKAGDLTWNAEANTVTFRQQRAINLQTRDQGEIHATGRDNVYLAGTKDTVFNISGIETQNDIKLMSDNGVHMIGTGLLQGKNLIIYGGNGSIGSEDKHIETKLSGTLDANSAKSVYLTQKEGVLTIQAVSAGEEVAITAADGMQMSTEEGKDMGYISAGTQISLASEKGDIGIADNGVRILNNGAVINADGKNINLAGKESGSLVLGNINAEGAFTLNSAGNVSLGRAQVENSEGQVVIPAVMGQVTAQDSGVINAVNIALDHGGITVNDTEGQLLLQATGNITQNAAADGIRVKSLTAVTGGGQSLLSQNNEISNFSAQSIGQDNSINGGVEFVSNAAAGLTVQLNNLQVKEGNVSISNIAAGGAMVIKGGINAAVGNIEFSGKGDLSTEGVLQAAEDIKMTASGSIINHDNVTAGAMLDMQAGKDITNNSTVEAGEALTMTAEGSIANKDTINAGGVVMLQAQTDISNSAAVTSGTGFGISMTAVTGGIANKGSVISGADVALKAQQDIFNEDDIRADAKILMEAAERDIVNQGSLTAGAEDAAIDLLAGRGDILNTNSSAAITAVGTVQMQAQAGNIGNAATIASGTGADVLLTADGNIVNSGAIGSGRLVSFAAGSNISNTAAITAVDSITMTAGNDINNSDMLTAGSSVILTAGNDIGNTAAITAAEAITMDAASDITSDGTLTAVKDIQLIADGGNINIDDGGTVTSKQGSINLVTKNTGAAGQGAITVNAALDAKNAINVLADHGDVFIGADATAQDGILTVNVAEGNIKSNHFDGGENPGGSDVKLTSVNGSVDIYTGKGDVDLHEVYAKDKASVGTENGHLRLCKIDGNIVVLIIKDMDNNMDVKEIIAGNQIVISGNKISLDDIKQRDDADGMLIISPGGADADEPIESFNIKNINTGNGVRFDKLWVKNADLHVDSGRFYIDKLAVVDVAHFSNRDMRTAVYGTPALRDGSDSIYWYDHAANDPKHDLLGWHNDNYLGNWMHLYFTDKYRTQISNGVLLSLKDHYYAHNQRFTGEDHLRFLKKEMPLDVHEKNNNPRISLYQRFALYELPEAEQQEGAEASIVVAEDV